MSVFANSAHGHREGKTKYRERDMVSSKRHGEACEDINRACKIWLLEHVPSYRGELIKLNPRNHGV